MLVCQAGTSFTHPQSKRTVPPRLGSWTFSTPCSPKPVGDLDDGDALGAGAGGDRDRIGHVVDVAVGDGDMGGVDVLGARHRGRVVGLEEGVDE